MDDDTQEFAVGEEVLARVHSPVVPVPVRCRGRSWCHPLELSLSFLPCRGRNWLSWSTFPADIRSLFPTEFRRQRVFYHRAT